MHIKKASTIPWSVNCECGSTQRQEEISESLHFLLEQKDFGLEHQISSHAALEAEFAGHSVHTCQQLLHRKKSNSCSSSCP